MNHARKPYNRYSRQKQSSFALPVDDIKSKGGRDHGYVFVENKLDLGDDPESRRIFGSGRRLLYSNRIPSTFLQSAAYSVGHVEARLPAASLARRTIRTAIRLRVLRRRAAADIWSLSRWRQRRLVPMEFPPRGLIGEQF